MEHPPASSIAAHSTEVSPLVWSANP